ncbi:hypothetical protein WR25_13673 [Diploscapter pachys]|uniref:Uncharacterized protein n=1 Tax=Diploscapter pachys TaxID=2018661 RepID=A0A2A2LEY0_9BILA|nr:hypothetical protein WR25_13673 [Diploscapter pachys]
MRLMSAHAEKMEKYPNFANLEHVGIVYDPDDLLRNGESHTVVLEMMTTYDQIRLNAIWMITMVSPVQKEFKLQPPYTQALESYTRMDAIVAEFPPNENFDSTEVNRPMQKGRHYRPIKDRVIEHLRAAGQTQALALSTFFQPRAIDGEFLTSRIDGLFKASAVIEGRNNDCMFIWCYDRGMASILTLARYEDKLKVGECFEGYFFIAPQTRIPRYDSYGRGQVVCTLRCDRVVKTVYPPFLCFDKNGRLHVRVKAKFRDPREYMDDKAVAHNEHFGFIYDYMEIMNGKPLPDDTVYVTACKVKVNCNNVISFVWGFYKVTTLAGVEIAVSHRPSFNMPMSSVSPVVPALSSTSSSTTASFLHASSTFGRSYTTTIQGSRL